MKASKNKSETKIFFRIKIIYLDAKLNEIIRKIEAYEKRLFAHALHGRSETEKIMLQGENAYK